MAEGKIIGYTNVNWNNEKIALDLYEGNFVITPDGRKGAISEQGYKKLLKTYQDTVAIDQKIDTAYEWNRKNQVKQTIPDESADPAAAEKEYAARLREKKAEKEEAEKKNKLEQERNEKELEEKQRKLQEDEAQFEQKKRLLAEEEEKKRILQEQKEAEAKAEEERIRKLREQAEAEAKAELEAAVQEEAIPEKEEETPTPSPVPTPDPKAEKVRLKQERREEKRRQKEEAAAAKAAAKLERKKVKEKNPESESSEETVKKTVDSLLRRSRMLTMLVIALLFVILFMGYKLYNLSFTQNTEQPASADTTSSMPQDEYICIKLVNDLDIGQEITEDDIDGIIYSAEKYKQYNAQTYIASDGSTKYMSLILYEDRDQVIGKYAASQLKAGSSLYDVQVSSTHVIADKTYVEATINGEDGTYEVEAETLPGNTDIKIVAVITTDDGDPVQILLSQMKLQDRSLESIFNSAGQDILKQLSGEDTESSPEEDADTQEEEQAE